MLRAAFTAGILLIVASPVHASDSAPGSSSNASATFTVYIPPIASAIEASSQGAAGLWSISGQHDGIMINLVRSGGFIEAIDIYSRQTSGIEVQWNTRTAAVQAPSGSQQGDLVKKHFALPKNVPLVSAFTIRSI